MGHFVRKWMEDMKNTHTKRENKCNETNISSYIFCLSFRLLITEKVQTQKILVLLLSSLYFFLGSHDMRQGDDNDWLFVCLLPWY